MNDAEFETEEWNDRERTTRAEERAGGVQEATKYGGDTLDDTFNERDEHHGGLDYSGGQTSDREYHSGDEIYHVVPYLPPCLSSVSQQRRLPRARAINDKYPRKQISLPLSHGYSKPSRFYAISLFDLSQHGRSPITNTPKIGNTTFLQRLQPMQRIAIESSWSAIFGEDLPGFVKVE